MLLRQIIVVPEQLHGSVCGVAQALYEREALSIGFLIHFQACLVIDEALICLTISTESATNSILGVLLRWAELVPWWFVVRMM